MLPLKQFCDSQIVITTNCVVVSNVGIKRVVCTYMQNSLRLVFCLPGFRCSKKKKKRKKPILVAHSDARQTGIRRSRVRSPPRVWQHSFVEISLEIFSTVILHSLPSADSRRTFVLS